MYFVILCYCESALDSSVHQNIYIHTYTYIYIIYVTIMQLQFLILEKKAKIMPLQLRAESLQDQWVLTS